MPTLTEEVRDMFTGSGAISGRTSDSGTTPPVWIDHKGLIDDHVGRVIAPGGVTLAFAANAGRGWFFLQRDMPTADVTGVFGLRLGNAGSSNHQEAGLFVKAKKVYSFGSGAAPQNDGYKAYRCTCSNAGVWALTRIDSLADDNRSVITPLTTSTTRPLPLDDTVYQITASAVTEGNTVRIIISDAVGEIINYPDTSANRITTAGMIGIDIFAFNADNGGCIDYAIGYSMATAPPADTTPPVLSNGSAAANTTTTATATVTTDEGAGTLYCYISTNSTETAATIRASGQSQAVTSAGVKTFSRTGLTANTAAYYPHFVQDDAASTPNTSNVLNGASFSTPAVGDTTAPTLTSPTGTKTGSTTATGTVTTNEATGTLRVLTSTNATETQAAVLASAFSQGVTAAGVQNVSRTGLTPGATMRHHYVHTDASGNSSNVSSSAPFTLDASATRTWTSAVTFVNIQGSGANMQGVPQTGIGVTAYVNAPNGTLVDTKAGLVTDGNGKVPAWTGTSGSLGVNYRVTYVKDSNSNALATEILQAT